MEKQDLDIIDTSIFMKDIDIEIKPVLNPKYLECLQEVEMRYVHPRMESLKLDDLYVYPDLEIINLGSEQANSIINSKNVFELESNLIILGDSESGKTTLIKQLFRSSLKQGYLPIIINANCFKCFDFKKCLDKIISHTYNNFSYEHYHSHSQRICFVDNFCNTKLSQRERKELLKKLADIFNKVIILADHIFRYDISNHPELDDYQELHILPLGHLKRTELIEKWVKLGQIEKIEDNKYWKHIDNLKHHVNILVGKNFVPTKPLYVLMFLSTFEAINTKKIELTSYGHCYQYLIYQQLERGKVKQDEIERYFNILSELAGALLDAKQYTFNTLELDDFFDKYSKDYLLGDRCKVIKKLVEANILSDLEGNIRFRYNYSFYFFAAKNLADNLYENKESEAKIKFLIGNIHLEGIGNIILFLTHHTKDPRILDEILYSIMGLFLEGETLTLEKDSLPFLQNFANKIPNIIMENRDARQERRKEDKLKDELEKINSCDHEPQLESQDENTFDLFNNIRQIFCAADVCGQILRNRMGSLKRSSLESIYEESLSSLLRLLTIFMQINDFAREQAIRKIEYFVQHNPEYSNEKITNAVENFFWDINYDLILSILIRIANALGSDKGDEIYEKITQEINTPASYLIRVIIELQFKKNLDVDKITRLHRKYCDNPIFTRMLRQVVIQYCYKHEVDYKSRQKLVNSLQISIKARQKMMLTPNKA